MATYDNLPVYKASYDLLQEITLFRKQLDREYKYTIGERLVNETVEMIIGVFKANVSVAKKDLILRIREHLEIVRLLLRLLKDLKQISLKRFATLLTKSCCRDPSLAIRRGIFNLIPNSQSYHEAHWVLGRLFHLYRKWLTDKLFRFQCTDK